VSDKKDLTLVDPAQKALQVAVKKSRKKPVNYAVDRILKKYKFSPLSILINQVFPNLPPKEQATVLLRLLEYQHAKVRPEQQKRKGPAFQTNVQVNLQKQETQQQQATVQLSPPVEDGPSLEELLQIATGKIDE
jgi:hypothetical protein